MHGLVDVSVTRTEVVSAGTMPASFTCSAVPASTAPPVRVSTRRRGATSCTPDAAVSSVPVGAAGTVPCTTALALQRPGASWSSVALMNPPSPMEPARVRCTPSLSNQPGLAWPIVFQSAVSRRSPYCTALSARIRLFDL